MSNKRILVPLMNGFEETEYIAVRDVLIREAIEVDSVSLTGDKLLTANHNTIIGADLVFGKQSISVDDYDGIFIPGGLIGVENLDKSLEFDNLINEFVANNKFIAAICAAPILLAKRGILKDKEAVCYPDKKFINVLNDNGAIYNSEKPFITSGKVSTAKDFETSLLFGYEIANRVNEWK